MEIDEIVTSPHRVEPWRIDDHILLALVPELSTRIRQLDALRVHLVDQIDERALTQKLGATTTAWLAGAGKLTHGQATKILATARALENRPDVTSAFTSGLLDLTQVATITGLLDKIPDIVADIPTTADGGVFDDPAAECTRQCTDYLLDAAHHDNATDTATRTAALERAITPDSDTPPDDENDQINEFFASPTTGGRVRVKGHFDKATGEQLLTALSALSKPDPGRNNTHGEPDSDTRTPAQRRADALTDIVRHYLDAGTAPGEGGETPHMTVFVGLDNLAHATRRTADSTGSGSGTDDATGDHRSAGESRRNTLGENCHGAGGDGGRAGDRSGTCDGTCETSPCPHTRTTAPHTTRRPSFIRRGPAWMPWLGPITDSLAATLSCDATVTAITMDADGTPLDVGRTTRLIPRRLRRALHARDCGCAFLGCGRPAAWTDGHHIHHWSHGGPTKLSNLVLLCRFHHRVIHKGDWQVFISDDGHPWFTPPRWIDPQRRPVPAHNRRHLAFTS
ncbi:HNH endonuclease signature motif containing protein [Rhodococcus olei]